MTPTETSSRLQWLRLQGKEVLFLDFRSAPVEESLALMAGFDQLMQGAEPESILLLTDVTDAEFDPGIASKWRTVRLAHSDKIKASAVYGLQGLVGMAIRGFYDMLVLLGNAKARQFRIFKDGQEARAWLAQQ